MWQPITTVPKDGTKVMLFCPDHKPKMCVGVVLAGELVVTSAEWALPPSHWMPLPSEGA